MIFEVFLFSDFFKPVEVFFIFVDDHLGFLFSDFFKNHIAYTIVYCGGKKYKVCSSFIVYYSKHTLTHKRIITTHLKKNFTFKNESKPTMTDMLCINTIHHPTIYQFYRSCIQHNNGTRFPQSREIYKYNLPQKKKKSRNLVIPHHFKKEIKHETNSPSITGTVLRGRDNAMLKKKENLDFGN